MASGGAGGIPIPPGQLGPVMVLNQKQQRQSGRPVQLSNIGAAKAVSNVIRTTLGPRSMLKMLLDPMGSIVLTNDGHCILREIDVSHPTAKSMLEISRSQDEEVGDGTTSVIVLTGEILRQTERYIRQDNVHPVVLVSRYTRALSDALQILDDHAVTIDPVNDTDFLKQLVRSTLGTKFSSRWNDIMVRMSIRAVLTVARRAASPSSTSGGAFVSARTAQDAPPVGMGGNLIASSGSGPVGAVAVAPPSTSPSMEIDLKRYAKIEKIPGGEVTDCEVLRGVMFQKDTVHSGMKRYMKNPRILLLDTPLEYKKGESQTNMEITNDTDWNALLKLEEEYVEKICTDIIRSKPDVVVTEKGVSDLAQHYLHKAGIVAFRRLRKTDNNRIARAVGATIVSRTEEIQESDIGTGCGTYEMKQIGNDWFCYLTDCDDPKACTIVLRGGSKDVLNEMERNLQDSMQVVRNVVVNPKLVPGGGAIEMAIAVALKNRAVAAAASAADEDDDPAAGSTAWDPYNAVADAMEIIPKTLAQNCGVNVVRTVTKLRVKHEEAAAAESKGDGDGEKKGCTWGIDGITGNIVDMKEHGVWDPYSVKAQTIQTAVESACMILRIDDIVSGSKRQS